MTRKAFTLTELLVGIAIMAILAASASMSARHFSSQTAKHEAERTAAYIQTHLRRADKTHDVLWFDVTAQGIEVRTGKDNDKADLVSPSFEVRTGCSFSQTKYLVCNKESGRYSRHDYTEIAAYAPVVASADKGSGSQQTITVNGADGEVYYVIIGG